MQITYRYSIVKSRNHKHFIAQHWKDTLLNNVCCNCYAILREHYRSDSESLSACQSQATFFHE